ncbi:MAG: hypothetical protein M1816_001684 [Peltula sp. TS41687]|nr:MAG: hypothetical protein M1816_001684 [Peltula sp. TS41687]
MDDRDERPGKRPRLDPKPKRKDKLLDIQTWRQLRELLRFQQDPVLIRKGLKSFRAFLESISALESVAGPDSANRRSSLQAYLEREKPRNDDQKDTHYLPDLMQAWSYASQSNDDSLLAAVPDVLALLLNKISTMIDFQEYGVLLCNTILMQAQLKLLSRGLSTNQAKEKIVSACLRLLTEVVSFDGGLLARKVYTLRESTFRSLARNLAFRKAASRTSGLQTEKLTVREYAIRYLLTNIIHQDAVRKGDLLRQKDVIFALYKDIKEDPSDTIIDILTTVERHVIQDKSIHSGVKRGFLTDWVLGRIATLYGRESSLGDLADENPVRRKAHEFLLLVCTTPSLGVLSLQSGWYPPGMNQDETNYDELSEQPDMPALKQRETKYREKLPIRNSRLAAFMLSLRPYSDILQNQLLLKIFGVAPELVADYFFKKRSFSFDPKLTATWSGYSMFLFSVIKMPVPRFCGLEGSFSRVPPPTSIVIENILPQPLTQKVLTRCLNQNTSLISFFAVRLLIVAFEKLRAVLQVYMSSSDPVSSTWDQAVSQLISEFCRRCPRMKDVITSFRSTPESQTLQREAIARLLVMYYKLIPQLALDGTFDVSVALSDALSHVDPGGIQNKDSGMHLLILEHLLFIAQCTPNMRWIHKPEHLKLSLFTTLLKLHVQLPEGRLRNRINLLLRSINKEAQIFQERTEFSALEALHASLNSAERSGLATSTYDYLDNTVIRLFHRPVHYEDKLSSLLTEDSNDSLSSKDAPISLLPIALVEQWPYLERSEIIVDAAKSVAASFLAELIGHCKRIGENERVLTALVEELVNGPGRDNNKRIFETALDQIPNIGEGLFDVAVHDETSPHTADALYVSSRQGSPSKDDGDDGISEEALPEGYEDSKALFSWINKDVQDAVEDGDVAGLIRCLSSDDLSIRMQALSGLAKFVQKMETSSYLEKQTTTLLLQETIHTAKSIVKERPFPTYLAAFSSRAVSVETDPQHPLYPKLNHFLQEGPVWATDRIPLMHKILLHPPEEDDTHYKEIEWFLDFVIEGFRTNDDLNVYRRQHTFERCCSLYSSPYLSARLQRKILQLISRATLVEGGSTTLVTRSGMLSWIDARLALEDLNAVTLRRLATRLYDTCDQGHVAAWNGGAIGEHMAGISRV